MIGELSRLRNGQFLELLKPTTPKDFDKSLPDGVIFEEKKQDTKGSSKRTTSRALTIESKITSRVTNDQLRRHTNGLRTRGFEVVGGLAITGDPTFGRDYPSDGPLTRGRTYHWLVAFNQTAQFGLLN